MEPVFGNFRAKVVDTDDPDQKGRIKAHIYPYFVDVDKEYLPWIVPAMPLFEGSGDGIGSFVVPKLGAFVWCFFEAGDIYQPVYFAEATDFVHGLPSERTVNYPNSKVWKTLGGITIVINDSIPSVSLSCEGGVNVVVNESVPSIVITSDNGLSIGIDASVPSITMSHPGGASISVNQSGVITILGTAVNINTE
jgi:hypothetical protein